MTNSNDQRILELKKQIEIKKEKLGESAKFTPVTNCSIEVDGIRYNIQVLSKEQLIELMVKINSYLLSAKDLGIANEYLISGFKVEDWVTDIKSKINVISRKDEEKLLKIMESRLLKLLTDGKKVELEIDEIEAVLGNN